MNCTNIPIVMSRIEMLKLKMSSSRIIDTGFLYDVGLSVKSSAAKVARQIVLFIVDFYVI